MGKVSNGYYIDTAERNGIVVRVRKVSDMKFRSSADTMDISSGIIVSIFFKQSFSSWFA